MSPLNAAHSQSLIAETFSLKSLISPTEHHKHKGVTESAVYKAQGSKQKLVMGPGWITSASPPAFSPTWLSTDVPHADSSPQNPPGTGHSLACAQATPMACAAKGEVTP